MNDICNEIKEKIKVTDLKDFIYADIIIRWGDSVKELKVRESKNYSLQIKLKKTVILRLSRKEEETQ
jgi:hypothetical protein